MSIVLQGSTSGSITLQEPAVAGTTTINLPASTGTMALLQTPSFATTIGVGNATPSTSGAGITFPATQAASSDANTLDDYEEGTWSPTILWGGSDTGAVYTFQVGTYTKTGNVVYFQGYTQITTQSSATGNLTVGGLPFTSSNTSNLFTVCHAGLDNTASDITQPKGRVRPNVTNIDIMSGTGTNNWSNLTNTIRAAAFRVFVAGHYYV